MQTRQVAQWRDSASVFACSSRAARLHSIALGKSLLPHTFCRVRDAAQPPVNEVS